MITVDYATKSGHVKMSNETSPQKSDWLKPSAIFGAVNMFAMIIIALQFYFGNEAKSADRLTKIETQLEFYILPLLRRIEVTANRVEKKVDK